MNKKGTAIFSILGAVLLCGPASHAAELTTIGNLTETSVKISEIDMDKDFGKAGNVLDSFYTGTITKGNQESPTVYADNAAPAKPAASAETICNAKPSKIVLSGKVPPLGSTSEKESSGDRKLPLGAGALAAGTIALAISGRKKGYFSNYGEDLDTVTDFLVDLVTTEQHPKPPPPNENYDVHPSGGAPTCNGENYCTRP